MSRKNRIALVVGVWGIACLGMLYSSSYSSKSSFVDSRKPVEPSNVCIRCGKPPVMYYLSKGQEDIDPVSYCSHCVLMKSSSPSGVSK